MIVARLILAGSVGYTVAVYEHPDTRTRVRISATNSGIFPQIRDSASFNELCPPATPGRLPISNRLGHRREYTPLPSWYMCGVMPPYAYVLILHIAPGFSRVDP